jgi:hypothetical protein
MITIGKEPEGVLLQRADIFAWVKGITVDQWKKIRPILRTHKLPGCTRTYYFRNDVRAKIVEPIEKEQNHVIKQH